MDLPQLDLSSWHTILVGLALELALENAGLVALSFWTERRWRERALVVVPLAAFVWLLATAREIEAQLTWWSHYAVFLAGHYPPGMYPFLYAQTQQEYQSVVQGADRLGWTAVLVTEGMVLLGGILLLWWGTGVWWGRTTTPVHPMPAQAEDDELEITAEHIGFIPKRYDTSSPRMERGTIPSILVT